MAIGDELVGGFTLDTNSHWLAERLRLLGFPAKRITAIRDRPQEIVEQVRRELVDEEVTHVFCSGGLGPTPDDRTFAALADALGRELTVWDDTRARIERRVQRMHEAGLLDSPEVTEGNLRMARIPAGPAHVFKNRRGMAPGVVYEAGGKQIFVLPGVPLELKAIFTEELEPQFLADGSAATVRELRFTFAVEARFYPLMKELEQSHPGRLRRLVSEFRDQGAGDPGPGSGSEARRRRDRARTPPFGGARDGGVGLEASASELALEERSLGGVLAELEREQPGLAGKGFFANPVEQVRPRGVEQVIALEREGQVVDLSERGLGPCEMAERDGSVQPDHRAVRHLHQGVVEHDDLVPVRLFPRSRFRSAARRSRPGPGTARASASRRPVRAARCPRRSQPRPRAQRSWSGSSTISPDSSNRAARPRQVELHQREQADAPRAGQA